MAKLINFRCPENLEADIARIGLEFYPKENDRGYDLTATMLAILQTGIDCITSQGLCLTKRNTASLTSHKTEDITELRNAIAEILTRLDALESVHHTEPEKMELTQPEPLPILDAIATFPSHPEEDSQQDALITLETDNRDEIPIKEVKEVKEPEMMVNPLFNGLEINQEPNASQNENKPTCPNCGSSKVRGNGNRKGKTTGKIIARRFECSGCSKQFSIKI